MPTTRRGFLGAAGATAAMGLAARVRIPEAPAAQPGAANVPAASDEKVLFWVAASTPCDKSLKFDEELYKDLLAYLKANGADGVVVLGTTGEYASFSVAERKKVAETAFKHRNGLNLIICSGTANFPETIELSQHAEANGAAGRADEVLLADFRAGENPHQSLPHSFCQRRAGQPRVAAQPRKISEPCGHQGFRQRPCRVSAVRCGISQAEHAHGHDGESQVRPRPRYGHHPRRRQQFYKADRSGICGETRGQGYRRTHRQAGSGHETAPRGRCR